MFTICHTELVTDNSDQISNNSEKTRPAVISYGHIELDVFVIIYG